MLRQLLSRAFWALSPWRLVTEPAPQRPSVIVGAPHTSNWDFVLMLAIAWRLRVPLHWLGKHSLFTSWRGPLMRALGGIPVDRSAPSRVVEEAVTPGGTRGPHTRCRPGCHRSARATGMPVVLGDADRTTMPTGLGPTLDPTDDLRADTDRIRAFYADKSGYRPSQRVEPRLREE